MRSVVRVHLSPPIFEYFEFFCSLRIGIRFLAKKSKLSQKYEKEFKFDLKDTLPQEENENQLENRKDFRSDGKPKLLKYIVSERAFVV